MPTAPGIAPTHTREDNGGVLAGDLGPTSTLPPGIPGPAEGQVSVTGTVIAAHLEGVALGALATPITVSTAERGLGGATITPALVNGKSTSIEWSAGTPLPLESDGGSLLLGPVTVDVADGLTMILDGVHGFAPGTYKIAASVAVGSEPEGAVTFIATDESTIEFRGTASTPIPSLTTDGSGTLSLQGDLKVVHPDRTITPASAITLDNGTYEIVLTPLEGGGFTLQALLQGPTH